MIEKLEWTQRRIITESHNGSNNQQQINNDRTIALEQTAAKGTGGGGLKCILPVSNLPPMFFCC